MMEDHDEIARRLKADAAMLAKRFDQTGDPSQRRPLWRRLRQNLWFIQQRRNIVVTAVAILGAVACALFFMGRMQTVDAGAAVIFAAFSAIVIAMFLFLHDSDY